MIPSMSNAPDNSATPTDRAGLEAVGLVTSLQGVECDGRGVAGGGADEGDGGDQCTAHDKGVGGKVGASLANRMSCTLSVIR